MAPEQIAQMADNAKHAERLLKLLANKARLRILCQLVDSPKSVSELQINSELSQSALSQHLAKLREGGVISAQKTGTSVYYSLASVEAQALMSTLYLIYCKD